jgi:hypothetical protein
MAAPQRFIALEEHCVTAELKAALDGLDSPNLRYTPQFMEDGLIDLADVRIAAMDRLGIDVQVLSHRPPGAQFADPATAVFHARQANDAIAAAIDRHPTRFAGFATLPLSDPPAAVQELARCVGPLGFKGAMVHGRVGGEFLDHPEFDPILRAAAELEVPIFLHPGEVDPAVRNIYYDHLQGPPEVRQTLEVIFASAGWGWHIEAGTHALRLILSGVFDRYPHLQMILGHWGEMVPFFIHRFDSVMSVPPTWRAVHRYFVEHFYVTPSGVETLPPLQMAMAVMGADRIMYAADYPVIPRTKGRAYIDEAPISDGDKAKIAHLNAERLLRL